VYFTGKCERIKRGKRDAVILVIGGEGTGKSSFALYAASLASTHKFTTENVVFDAESFAHRVETCEENSCVICDEGAEVWYGRAESMSNERKRMNQLMMRCRERNLLTFILIPDIRLLESYIRGHRASCLCRIVNKYDLDRREAVRGIVYVYPKRELLQLPKDKSGAINWKKMRPAFVERFPRVVGPLWDAYVECKREYLGMRKEKKTKIEELREKYSGLDDAGIREKLMKECGYSRTWAFALQRKQKEKEEKECTQNILASQRESKVSKQNEAD
jgi:hypothetical protein